MITHLHVQQRRDDMHSIGSHRRRYHLRDTLGIRELDTDGSEPALSISSSVL
jgi:hypothetical protein